MNRIKEQPQTKQKGKTENSVANKFLDAMSHLNVFPGEKFAAGIATYMLFLMGIALAYIANSYYAEKTVRNIDHITKELKTLRSEYISSKSELMFYSKQSEVAKSVAPFGLVESTVAPKKIVLKSSDKEH